jgi:hypothetical protein
LGALLFPPLASSSTAGTRRRGGGQAGASSKRTWGMGPAAASTHARARALVLVVAGVALFPFPFAFTAHARKRTLCSGRQPSLGSGCTGRAAACRRWFGLGCDEGSDERRAGLVGLARRSCTFFLIWNRVPFPLWLLRRRALYTHHHPSSSCGHEPIWGGGRWVRAWGARRRAFGPGRSAQACPSRLFGGGRSPVLLLFVVVVAARRPRHPWMAARKAWSL